MPVLSWHRLSLHLPVHTPQSFAGHLSALALLSTPAVRVMPPQVWGQGHWAARRDWGHTQVLQLGWTHQWRWSRCAHGHCNEHGIHVGMLGQQSRSVKTAWFHTHYSVQCWTCHHRTPEVISPTGVQMLSVCTQPELKCFWWLHGKGVYITVARVTRWGGAVITLLLYTHLMPLALGETHVLINWWKLMAW